MKTFTILGGLDGCGKSSLAGILRAERTDLGCVIDCDLLTARLGSPLAGGRAAVAKVEQCLQQGASFTQETTPSGVRTVHTARRAKEAGYHIRLYYVGLETVEESLSRIANRVKKGGHAIPPQDVARRFSTRFSALLPLLPYCDEASFYDNDNGFALVAEYRNGTFFPFSHSSPTWVKELQGLLEAQG